MKRKQVQQTVEDKAQQAADLGAQALSTAKAKIGPYVEQASEKVTPLAEKVGPLAHDAVTKSAQVTVQALDSLQPHIEEAISKIAPVIEDAREKVTGDFLPKVSDVLHETAARPYAFEANAASSSEVEVAEKKKGGGAKKFFLFSTIAAGIAGAVLLVKKLTESKSGWEPHTPSSYTPPTFSTDQAAEDMTAEGSPLAEKASDGASEPAAKTAEEPLAEAEAAADEEQLANVAANLGIADDELDSDEHADGTAASESADEDRSGGDEKPFRK